MKGYPTIGGDILVAAAKPPSSQQALGRIDAALHPN